MKTVLITGASRGIGAAAARRFAAEGWQVAINYLSSQQEAEALAKELGGLAVRGDVSERMQVDEMVKKVRRELGEIDALVNNAGIAQQKLFTDLTAEDWKRMMDVDVTGVFHCCQSVLPRMISAHRGTIINVSSIWGMAGASCEVHYSAAKAAVIGLTKALAKEVGPSGVRVNCVAPGVVETKMNAQLPEETLCELREETPLQLLGRPEDIADAIFFLASDRAAFITGQVLSPNGGIVI